MKDLYEIIKPELATLLITFLTALLSYVGHQIKKMYEEKIKDEKKCKVIKTVVTAVEETYKSLSGNEKFQKAKENIKIILKEKKITINDLELDFLIEEAIHCCKKGEID